MSRFVFAVGAAVASVGLALGGPVPNWGYKVYTEFAPTPVISAGTNLAATDTVTISAADINAALTGRVGDPDPNTHLQAGTQIQQSIQYSLKVMFISGTPSYYDWPDVPVYGRTYDWVGWGVTRDWTKAGDTWTVTGETYNGMGAWYGDNYSGYFDTSEQRYVWNRYDARLNLDGSLTLSMTPDVGVNPRFVPEPGTVVMSAICLAGLLAAGRRKLHARGSTNTPPAHG